MTVRDSRSLGKRGCGPWHDLDAYEITRALPAAVASVTVGCFVCREVFQEVLDGFM